MEPRSARSTGPGRGGVAATRRDVLVSFSTATVSAAAALSGGLSPAWAAAGGRIDVVRHIDTVHRIAVGPLRGAFVVAPAGMVNWYFANLALTAIRPSLDPATRERLILAHLDLCLSRLDGRATIADVSFAGGVPTAAITLHRPDSHDSYASTLLSLAAGLVGDARGRQWLAAHLSRLKEVAEANLLAQMKPNGLVRVFQAGTGLPDTGYFMDNCENLAGLRDFAVVLDHFGDRNGAATLKRAVTRIADGLKRLWDAPAGRFRAADDGAPAGRAFYPDATCQVFPQLLGIGELSSYWGGGWRALMRLAPNWAACGLDPHPWALLGRVAALRGERAQASAQTAVIEARLPVDPARVPIHDLGFHHLTRRTLGI